MAAIDCPGIILTSDIPVVEPIEKQREQEPGVSKSIGTWEAINRIHEEGGIMKATTPGLFMMIEGDKEYNTFLEMLRDQPQMPDPVFKEGDVEWTVEDAGFPLDRQDEIDAEFKKMYDEMFSRINEFGTMGPGEFEMRLVQRQNELSEGKIENLNGGGTDVLLARRPSIYETQRTTTPVHTPVSISSSGSFTPSIEEGSNENDGRSNV
jgi:hypothetical protein